MSSRTLENNTPHVSISIEKLSKSTSHILFLFNAIGNNTLKIKNEHICKKILIPPRGSSRYESGSVYAGA